MLGSRDPSLPSVTITIQQNLQAWKHYQGLIIWAYEIEPALQGYCMILLQTNRQFKQQMQTLKSIQIFLEKNNLLKTLQIFKNEVKSRPVQNTGSRNSQLASIHKIVLTNKNANQIRDHLQATDELVLRRAVRRLKHNRNITRTSNGANITTLPFFRRLLEKENINASNETEESVVAEFRESRARLNPLEQSRQYDNEWEGDHDLGYELYECTGADLEYCSKQIANHKKMEQITVKMVPFPEDYYAQHQERISKIVQNIKDRRRSRLPAKTLFKHEPGESVYPIQHEGTTYDSYQLKIIYDREKTGFEQERELPIVINEVLAARYQVVGLLGQAAFSKVIEVVDLETNKNCCIKIIQNSKEENSKDYFDQSIDEIKLLRYIAANCNTDECNLLTLHDFFYHREHLMIVTELLKDNLLDAYQMYPKHFDLRAIQVYSRQILRALEKMHSLHIIHTDLKPENILIKSYSKQELKVIDLGSSIFFHDKLSFYVQTRSYRAPEVILGCPYDDKIDIWSFGCIIAELYTGEVLFSSETVADLLAKMQGMRGPWPSWMMDKSKCAKKYFTADLIPYAEVESESAADKNKMSNIEPKMKIYNLYVPKLTNLKSRINCEDKLFIDFLSKCLKLDPTQRMSAKEALKHPFLNQ